MKRAAKSPFIRLLSLGLGLELMIAPLAHAIDNSTISGIANTMGTLSNTAQQMMQQAAQHKMAQQMSQGLQTYVAQQVPPNQVAVPIFSGCSVFMAETNQPAVGQRCEPSSFDPSMVAYYSALGDIATTNVETYGLYTIKGNATSSEGQRCLDTAEEQFKALLDSRAEDVSKLIEQLNAELMVFDKENEPLLNNIKKGNALLFGKPAELLKDTKFETKFNDVQCASLINSTEIQELGNNSGYEGIRNTLKAKSTESVEGGFNAKSFLTQQANIQQDIISVANQLANKASSMNHMTLMTNADTMKGVVKSKYNIKNLPGFTEAFDRQKQKLIEKQENIKNQVLASMSDDEAELYQRNLQDPTLDTESIVQNYQNLSDTKCVQEVFNQRFGGVDQFVDLLRDPTVSEKMGREADNKLKNNLPSILSDSTLTIKEKLNRIASSSGVKNTRYQVQRTETVNGVSLRAGDFMKVTDLFQGVIIEDCKRLANTNNDKGESPNNIINNIKQYHAELKEAYETYPAQLKADIQDELLTCSSDTSVGAAGTCSANSLDLNGNNFCLKRASTCASNMVACADKAQQIFDTTRNEQLALAKTYKTKLDATKTKLMGDYMGIKTVLEQKARSLDALFPGQVYGVVTDDILKLTTENKNLYSPDEIDSSLQIENPEAFVKQMINNLKKLADKEKETGAIYDQNKAILAKVENEKKSIIDNATAQKRAWETIASNCNSLINQYNKNIADQTTKQNEENQKRTAEMNEFCAETRKMTSCPTEGEVESLNNSASKIAAYLQPGDATAISNYRRLATLCGTGGDESSNRFVGTNENSNQFPGAKKVCDGVLSSQPECTAYNSYANVSQECKDPGKKSTYPGLYKEVTNTTTGQMEVVEVKNVAQAYAEKADEYKECLKNKTKAAEAEKEVAKIYKQHQNAKLAKDMGQQSFPSCGATSNSEFGKTAGDAARGIAGALQENKAVSQQ